MTGWPDGAKEIIAGDLCAAFAYTTRFGGVSVAPVCPFGIFDEDDGTIESSVAMAFVDKLRRLAVAPEAALGFFTRTHGQATTPGYVLAQGEVTFPEAVPDGYLDALHARWSTFLGSVPDGGFVRRLGGGAYYDKRLPVTLHVRRLLYWQEVDAAGEPTDIGAPRPVPGGRIRPEGPGPDRARVRLPEGRPFRRRPRQQVRPGRRPDLLLTLALPPDDRAATADRSAVAG